MSWVSHKMKNVCKCVCNKGEKGGGENEGGKWLWCWTMMMS